MPLQEDDIKAGDSSDELQPGESSSDDNKLKKPAIEEGIPIGKFRKYEKGKRRLAYGSFDANLTFVRRLSKRDIKGNIVGGKKYNGGAVSHKDVKFLKGWEGLGPDDVQRRVFEKLKKKGRMEVSNYEDLADKRTVLLQAQRAKSTQNYIQSKERLQEQ